MYSLLLIDDNEKLISALSLELQKILNPDEVLIKVWVPTSDDLDPRARFESLVDSDTLLVITDYDLTSQGQTGLFGVSIVSWCQTRRIPVGDFSRGNPANLPREPNLFELRIPTEESRSSSFIASVFRGFRWLREETIKIASVLDDKRSPAAALATLLNVPQLESQFSLYGGRLASTNSSLLEKIVSYAPKGNEASPEEKRELLTYIVGHLLLNAILKFPGPILSARALVAYVAAKEAEPILGLFDGAKYRGPFFELDSYFWLSKVDELLDEWGSQLEENRHFESQGEMHREIVETKLGGPIDRHDCSRCGGKNGGFLCPFTGRIVCQRADCSVGSSSWIPPGARLCRIERDFYDELAPILGM